MYNQIGTPEDAKRSEKEWNDRLLEIEEKLKSYHVSSNSPMSQVITYLVAKFEHLFYYMYDISS